MICCTLLIHNIHKHFSKLHHTLNKRISILLPVPVEPVKELQAFPGKEIQPTSGSSHISRRNDFIQGSVIPADLVLSLSGSRLTNSGCLVLSFMLRIANFYLSNTASFLFFVVFSNVIRPCVCSTLYTSYRGLTPRLAQFSG